MRSSRVIDQTHCLSLRHRLLKFPYSPRNQVVISTSSHLAFRLNRLVAPHSASLPVAPLKEKWRNNNNGSSLSLSSFRAKVQRPSTSSDQTRYRIGSHTMSGSLVGVESIKAHLRLLATFKRLRQRVESSPSESLPDVAQFLDGPQRWAWFVGLAVER